MNQLWIEMAWKSTIVLTAGFGASYVLRRAPAAVRHFAWTAALAMLVLLPAVAIMGPRWNAPQVLPASAEAATTVVVGGSERPAPARVGFELIYLAGALLAASRFAVGIARTLRMSRNARAAAHAAP